MVRSKSGWKAWGDHPIIVTIMVITAVVGTVIAVSSLLRKEQQTEYIGRILDSRTRNPIRSAKVTLEFRGAPPIVYTDSEGVYRFSLILGTESTSGRVRVEADGYTSYDRNITLTFNNLQLEDIRLIADTTFTATPISTAPTTIPAPILSSPAAMSCINSDYSLRIVNSEGKVISCKYTDNGLLAAVSDEQGHIISYVYDARNRLVQYTDENGNIVRMNLQAP
jgi:hypothetical protein